MKEEKKEDFQSRRQFFKRVAKTALPILGAIAIANTPLKVLASESEVSSGCTGTCYTLCKNGCKGCEYTCKGTCANSCKNYCKWSSK